MTGQHPSPTERLAQHLCRPVDDDARGRARLHLLDWLGCVAGARGSATANVVVAAEFDPLIRAAYLGNLLEMDDVHRDALLHPGPVVWPAALRALTMTRALVAAVRGYEAMIGVGATFDAYHYAHWHPTSTAGMFGATAAALAAGCGDVGMERGLVAAFGNAGSVASGLWQMRHHHVMTKQWHVAHVVRTAMEIEQLTDCGLTGPAAILEGPQGLYAATCREPKPMVLGEDWRIAEVSFKPWAACRHAHPAIDAALTLREAGRLGGEMLVETYRDAVIFCDKPTPTTVLEAKFSIQHAVAVVAERGEPTLADFEPDAIVALASARSRVRVVEAADITARYPAHFGARVTAGGERVELVDTLGDPERPLSREGVVAKARALFDWGGVGADADAAVAACLEGDDSGAVVALLERWL